MMFHFLNIDDSVPFGVRITHTDMNDAIRSTYNVGDYTKFKVALLSTILQVKAVRELAILCHCEFNTLFFNTLFFKFRCDLEERTSWVTKPIPFISVFKTEAFCYAPSGNTIYAKCIIWMCLVTDNSTECVRLVIMMIVVSVVLFRRRLLISLLVNLPRDWWLSEQQSSTFWRKVCVLLFFDIIYLSSYEL